MTVSRRGLLGTAVAASALVAMRVRAQQPTITIGVLTDMSGAYRDAFGPLSVACTRQAVDEIAQSGAPFEARILVADHQNKADIGAGIAREWFDKDGVDMIVGADNSAVGLAVQTIVREKNKVLIAQPATSAITGEQCSPNCVHWHFDTYMLANSTGGATVASGGDSWFFITPNYAFGHQLEKDTTTIVERAGGRVLGSVRYPFPETTDFSTYLQQAAASGARVLGLATAGVDTVNCVKQAHEFNLHAKMQMAALWFVIPLARAIGIEVAQGLLASECFYWDLNERTRAFAGRMAGRFPDAKPDTPQAGAYAGTLHYLKTLAAMGGAAAKADGVAIVNRMKAMPFDDDAFGTGTIRQDGRAIFNAYLFQVKKPSESAGPWDLYKTLAVTPGEQAFRPLAEGHCSFVKL
jgi:branched-chain amino acid transport system substrate-binding protein